MSHYRRAMRFARLTFAISVFALSISAHAQRKVSLGKLGQALEQVPIYASPTTSARKYYTVRAYEYLIIQNAKQETWLRVLLQNGKFGYVPAEKVARLPYDVTQTQSRPSGSSVSRGSLPNPSGGTREQIANYSLNYVGTKYVWGGNDLNNGIDCSGFVKALYGKIGISLPRTAAEQALVGEPISRLEDLRPGDRLYFWSDKRNKIGHTGIYLGNGFFSHSTPSRNGVGTDDLRNPHYRKMLVAARR